MIVRAERIICAEPTTAGPRHMDIRDGKVQGISEEAPFAQGKEICDFSGRTISPCFCDYHLHIPFNTAEGAGSIIDILLRHGIVQAFDGGDRRGVGLEIRKHSGKVRIKTAGYALYKQGGYGSYLGRPAATWKDAERIVHELCNNGIDYLKLIQSGVYDPESGLITKGGFEKDEIGKIVVYAQELGLEVFCHANGEKAVREAVEAGVSAVIHGLDVTRETLSIMAERKTAFIPTVNAFKSLRGRARSDTARLNVDRAVDRHLSVVQTAFQLGVRLLPGSDAGPDWIPHGEAYIEELRMFLSAGIPYEHILQTASASPLKAGMPADFVVLDGLTVENVMLDGRFLLP